MSCYSSSKRAFTLIEVMVAITITMILVSSVYFSFSTLMTGRSRIQEHTERQRRIFFAVDMIKKDLVNAYLTANTGTPEITHETVFKAEEDEPVTHVTFASFNHQPLGGPKKQCDQTEIEYWGEERDDKNVLLRRESFWVDDDSKKGGNVYPLLTGFESLSITFWDRKSEEWKPEWDSAAPESGGMLPEKIRITLKVKRKGDDREPLTVDTVVTIGKRTPIRY